MRILIGVPTHSGSMIAGTALSIMSAASLRGHRIEYAVHGISLLARNFNNFFCKAWNAGYEYLVLLHSDVSVASRADANGSWVDVLVDRCERAKAAVISVALPIKSDHGVTSMGLLMDAANIQSVRRVTMAELQQLPKDYIARDDICDLFQADPAITGAMLVNTGCMAMRLRGQDAVDWTQWPGFAIHDKVLFNREGVADCRTEPEDWRLSRWMYENGWPYYANRELMLEHIGLKAYPNNDVWGVPVDDTPVPLADEQYQNTGGKEAA